MAQSYNWQNATDNLLPFQDFLWQLQSDKPQEIYFRNGGGNLNIKITVFKRKFIIDFLKLKFPIGVEA